MAGGGILDEEKKDEVETDEDSAKELRDLLSYGGKAKETMYYKLLLKIQQGTVLTATEQRTFTTLDTELNIKLAETDAEALGLAFGYTDAAKYLGFSKRTLHYHVHKGHIKQEPDGSFLKEELDRHLAGEGRVGEQGVDDYQWKKEQADLSLRQARAARERFMVKQLEAQYAPVAEVAAAWAGRMKEFCTAVRAWKNNLSILLVGKDAGEIKDILDRESESVITSYVRDGKWTPTPTIVTSTED